jgi:hypothetical protein
MAPLTRLSFVTAAWMSYSSSWPCVPRTISMALGGEFEVKCGGAACTYGDLVSHEPQPGDTEAPFGDPPASVFIKEVELTREASVSGM